MGSPPTTYRGSAQENGLANCKHVYTVGPGGWLGQRPGGGHAVSGRRWAFYLFKVTGREGGPGLEPRTVLSCSRAFSCLCGHSCAFGWPCATFSILRSL